MSSVREIEDHFIVNLASPSKSEVTVEVHMSRETAEKIVARENAQLAKLNLGRAQPPPATLGSAVMSVLGNFAANGKV